MKKGLIFLLGIISFFGINKVSAATETTVVSHFYNNFDQYISHYNEYKENIDDLINYWELNCSSTYPFYVVVDYLNGGWASSTGPTFYLLASNSNSVYSTTGFTLDNIGITLYYDSSTDTYNYGDNLISPTLFDFNIGSSSYIEHQALLSNGLVYKHSLFSYLIPTYVSETFHLTINEIKLSSGINYPTIMDLYNNTYEYNPEDAIDIDLDSTISDPLGFLKDSFDVILSIFDMIGEFISLLPPVMQGFLLTAFSTIILLGIIKMIL